MTCEVSKNVGFLARLCRHQGLDFILCLGYGLFGLARQAGFLSFRILLLLIYPHRACMYLFSTIGFRASSFLGLSKAAFGKYIIRHCSDHTSLNRNTFMESVEISQTCNYCSRHARKNSSSILSKRPARSFKIPIPIRSNQSEGKGHCFAGGLDILLSPVITLCYHSTS